MTQAGRLRVRVGSKLALLTRANTIAHIAREVAQALGATEDSQQSILDAVQRQLLSKIEFVLYTNSEAVGYAAIEVDWEEHVLILTSGSKESEVRVDTSLSVSEQLAPRLAQLNDYIAEATVDLSVDRVLVGYHRNPAKSAEYEECFGGKFKSAQLSDFERARKGRRIRVKDGNYPGLVVEIRHIVK